MKGFKTNREFKEKVSPHIIRAIRKAIKPYGNKTAFSGAVGVSATAIKKVVAEKKATPSMLKKIQNALKQAA